MPLYSFIYDHIVMNERLLVYSYRFGLWCLMPLISVISWQSVLLVEVTTDLSQVTDKLYHIMLYRVHLA